LLFGCLLVAWVSLQLLVMKRQQSKPKFLIPRRYRHLFFKDYYVYERFFVDEVDKDSVKQLFSLKSELDEENFTRAPPSQRAKKQNKITQLKQKDCVVCLLPIGQEQMGFNEESQERKEGMQLQQQSFMRTPCNHLYHVKCLKDWLNQQRHNCPICRRPLPIYHSI